MLNPQRLHVVRYRGLKLPLHKLSTEELRRNACLAEEHIEQAQKFVEAVHRELSERLNIPFDAS